MRKYLIYLLALFAVTACSDYDEYRHDASQSGKLEFGTSAGFLRLQDDSTRIAGTLEITANTPSVELKWNVPPVSNLDTTVTELSLENGRVQLPIKWASKLADGVYGPVNAAYSAGVLITSGNDSKYVPLVWADEVDSVKIMEQCQIMTRAGRIEMPTSDNQIIIDTPNPLPLDKDTCGTIKIRYINRCNVNFDDFSEATDFDKYHLALDKLPPQYTGSDSKIPLNWTEEGAPEIDFGGHLKLSTMTGYTKFAYITYTLPTPCEWEFIKCIPDSLSLLPAKNASVVAVARTNSEWSIRYRNEDGVEVRADAVALPKANEQSLFIRIADNDSLRSRNILVGVYLKDSLERTLKFTQSSAQGSFNIKSVKPMEGTHLKAEKDTVIVEVDTSRDWWISYGSDKKTCLASENEGKVVVPANTGSTTKEIVVNVGYDNILVNTYVYIQDFGSELIYDSWDESGEIPVEGGTYMFHFHGSYVGNLQVRVKGGDRVLATGPATTGKDASITIPNNYLSLAKRVLTFEYYGPDGWKELKGVTATQDEAKIISQVLPSTAIPREGDTTTGIFSGTYKGTIDMKAESGGEMLKENTGNCPGSINLDIPAMPDTAMIDRKVSFFYSANGGTTWISMGSRTQLAGSLTVGSITPNDEKIPAEGKEYSCSFTGTYPGNIVFAAFIGEGELVRESGNAPVTMKLAIPKNDKKDKRTVTFKYSKDGGKHWTTITEKVQTSDIKIGSGDNNVGDFEDKGDITGGIGGDI